jgi:hypothetical protein
MRGHIAILMFVSILSTSVLPICSSFAQTAPMYNLGGNSNTDISSVTKGPPTTVTGPPFNQTTTPGKPVVMHPSKDTINAINEMLGYDNRQISNSSQGNVSGIIEAAAAGNSIYVAWMGKINGTNHVFVTISNDNGRSFTNPVELTSKDSGNATKLDICASGNIISTAWQEKNSTSGKSGVFGSISYNKGDTFTTSQISAGNVTARDPVIPPGACLIVLYVIEEGEDDPIVRWNW